MTPASTAHDRLLACLAWGICLGLGLLLFRLSHLPEIGYYHLNDDQMITMRVAFMIATEGVPYYNLDEEVAANTSLFWPYVLSLLFVAGLDIESAVAVLFALSTAAYCALCVFVAWQVRGWATRSGILVFLVLGGSAFNYAGSGWEHVPQTIFATIGLVALIRGPSTRNWLIAFYAVAAAFLMRPDVAVVIAYLFLAATVVLGSRDRMRFIGLSLPALVFPAAYVAGMLLAYGDVVPNTWYLKRPEGGDTLMNGAAYLIDPRQSGLVPALSLICLACWARLHTGERIVLGAVAVHMAYVVWIGGDFFRAGRFFLFLFPAVTLIVARQAVVLGRDKLLLAIACFAGVAWIYESRLHSVLRPREHLISQLGLIALVRETLPPEEGSIGLHTLGLGYHLPDHHIVDFLGKADPVIARAPRKWGVIAHDKWDYAHSFSGNRIAAMPVHHATMRRVEWAPQADFETPRHTYMAPMAAYAMRTGEFTYLSPRDLCRGGSFGLLVRHALAPRVEADACGQRGD